MKKTILTLSVVLSGILISCVANSKHSSGVVLLKDNKTFHTPLRRKMSNSDPKVDKDFHTPLRRKMSHSDPKVDKDFHTPLRRKMSHSASKVDKDFHIPLRRKHSGQDVGKNIS